MDFSLNEDQLAIKEAMKKLAERVFAPKAAYHDETKEFPRENMRVLAEQGYLGLIVPEEYGGSGAGTVANALVIEEISKVCASTATTYEAHVCLFTVPLVRFGTEAQKKKYLPDVACGKKIGALALTEPQAGSDLASLKVQAVLDGDSYVLNGRKCFITNAGQADIYLILVVTDKTKGTKGTAMILVENGTPGLSYGKPENKMGLCGSHTADVIMEDCRVPRENLLGNLDGQGFKIAMDTLDEGRIGVASQSVGIAQAALEASIKYSKERQQFGKPIAEFQAIQWMLAEMATDIDAARLLVRRAAWMHEQGMNCNQESSMAKMFASHVAVKHTSTAVQVHGGYGYIREYTVERFMRDARVMEIYEGTTEVQKMVIARSLLR
jgi:butyryl-CoA dehydrogenase